MKTQLLGLYLLLLIQNSICSVSVVSAWKMKSINGSIFTEPTIQNDAIAMDSDVKCASIAVKLKWPNVMYFDTGVCHLAQVDLSSCQNVFIQGSSAAVEGKWLYRGRIFKNSYGKNRDIIIS